MPELTMVLVCPKCKGSVSVDEEYYGVTEGKKVVCFHGRCYKPPKRVEVVTVGKG